MATNVNRSKYRIPLKCTCVSSKDNTVSRYMLLPMLAFRGKICRARNMACHALGTSALSATVVWYLPISLNLPCIPKGGLMLSDC